MNYQRILDTRIMIKALQGPHRAKIISMARKDVGFHRRAVIQGIGSEGISRQNSGPKAYPVGGPVKALDLDAPELPPKVITA